MALEMPFKNILVKRSKKKRENQKENLQTILVVERWETICEHLNDEVKKPAAYLAKVM